MAVKLSNKRWEDLTPQQKTRGITMGIIQLMLLIAALVDIRRRPAERINGKKWVWALVSMINFIGPVVYFVFGRKR
jgi:hypothetical protein